MSTTYQGIDYGRGIANVDPETGIRYGVIAQGSINPEAFDDVWTNARDLSYENAVEQFKRQIAGCETGEELRSVVREHCGHRIFQGDTLDGIAVGDVEAVWSEVEDHFNDYYSMGDCLDAREWLYECDGYKLANCLHTDVFVLASPFFTYAQFCSPCVPGACNLDSPLEDCGTLAMDSEVRERIADNRCYALGHDYFDDGKAPYPVYSVATGELVAA